MPLSDYNNFFRWSFAYFYQIDTGSHPFHTDVPPHYVKYTNLIVQSTFDNNTTAVDINVNIVVACIVDTLWVGIVYSFEEGGEAHVSRNGNVAWIL